MKRYAKILLKARVVITILVLLGNLFLNGQDTPHEYQLKAAFLFNFTQFVEWPPAAFPSDDTPWIIGVLGENPFGSYLDQIVAGEKVNGHTVVVNYYKTVEDVKSCHILFIKFDDAKKQELTMTALAGKNILTVSDAPDFSQSGGIIRLFTSNNKIKIGINLEASKAANLVISSKLLKLAEITNPK